MRLNGIFWKRVLRMALRPVGAPILRLLRRELAIDNRPVLPPTSPPDTPSIPTPPDTPSIPISLLVTTTARSLASTGHHHIIRPAVQTAEREKLTIGFYGNIANNAYNFVKCLDRMGHHAELVVEDEGFDSFVMNRPAWEDVEFECESYEEGLAVERDWQQPSLVRRVNYDPEAQQYYQGRQSAIPEVQELYQKNFGQNIADDRALLLAQQMGHWPLILSMGRYDVVQLSAAAISMGIFSPRPTVVFPTGSDLFLSPFREDLFGLLMRAGYRGAHHTLICNTNYGRYLDRLGITANRSFAPMMIDTDTYSPGDAPALRSRWASGGGERFAVQICRQSWEWKGNNRLLRGFAKAVQAGAGHWRLVLMSWGQDLSRSQNLVKELGLEAHVIWEPLCSKPSLRLRQRAADLVIDEFAIEGYGTSVLESMAAGRAVLIRPVPKESLGAFKEPPPFLGASDAEEISTWFLKPELLQGLSIAGERSRKWLEDVHGYKAVAPVYLNAYDHALGKRLGINQ